MNSDNFHLIVQHRKGYWRLVPNQSMSWWQADQNRADWKRANREAKKATEYDTLEKALDAGNEAGYTEFGEVVINYEDYYYD